jgi:hypothetical protein
MTCQEMSTWHAMFVGSSLRLVKDSYGYCYDRLRLWVYGLVLSEPKIMDRKEVVITGGHACEHTAKLQSAVAGRR